MTKNKIITIITDQGKEFKTGFDSSDTLNAINLSRESFISKNEIFIQKVKLKGEKHGYSNTQS